MAARKTNLEKLAQILNAKIGRLSDCSSSYAVLEDRDTEICFYFDNEGKHFERISVSEKKWGVVSCDIITVIVNKQ